MPVVFECKAKLLIYKSVEKGDFFFEVVTQGGSLSCRAFSPAEQDEIQNFLNSFKHIAQQGGKVNFGEKFGKWSEE
jgi:hypothetical protein